MNVILGNFRMRIGGPPKKLEVKRGLFEKYINYENKNLSLANVNTI